MYDVLVVKNVLFINTLCADDYQAIFSKEPFKCIAISYFHRTFHHFETGEVIKSLGVTFTPHKDFSVPDVFEMRRLSYDGVIDIVQLKGTYHTPLKFTDNDTSIEFEQILPSRNCPPILRKATVDSFLLHQL